MARLRGLLSLLSLFVAVFALPVIPDPTLNSKKRSTTYDLAFSAGGDHDASVQGYGYLTFTRLNSYDLPTCESWCDKIAACAFINLFYEYNSDATYNPQVKCVAYAVPQTAADKTNFGGQQLLPPPAGTSYIQDSVGYTSEAFANPPTPDGFSLVFGPINAATEADGLLESHSLSFYDTDGCANLCNGIGPNCAYFNIWLGVQSGNPTYTCVMYSATTDASTATNTGQNGLQVTNSRGYTRIIAVVVSHANLISDGGFEDNDNCHSSCSGYPTGPWSDDTHQSILYQQQDNGEDGEAWVLMYPSAHLRYTPTLDTVPGHAYLISIFAANFGYSDGHVEVYWNGVVVLIAAVPQGAQWATYTVQVTAVGSDLFAVGPASGDTMGVDDVSVTAV